MKNVDQQKANARNLMIHLSLCLEKKDWKHTADVLWEKLPNDILRLQSEIGTSGIWRHIYMLNGFDNELPFMNNNQGWCKPFLSLQEGQARKEKRIEFRNFFEGFSFHILQYEPSNLFQLQSFLRIHLRAVLFWVINQRVICLFVFGVTAASGPGPPHSRGFIDHTHQRTTISRTPLDGWSARRRVLYMTMDTKLTTTNVRAAGGIRTHNLSRGAVEDLRLRPRGHWDRSSG